ncbi:MAG: isoleucine--tRNA ligase [Salinisphaera sp.]|jgi:isoleucyl-tRNA synthetase|nr:isoleucine--tRNA ligase [Salinisphaera sp.]
MSGFTEHKPLNLPALEADTRAWWDAAEIFEASTAARDDQPVFTFYEGPPTANGRPGIHHVLGRTVKDAFCRYKTMQGFRVDRKAGWDTHGLPVEIEVEKELGLKSREDIEAYGIEAYNAACRASVLRYKDQWDELTRRIGYWVDLDTPYVTFSNEYIESVWWLLKQLHEKGLLYKGHKIHWYSPGSGTVLSSHEVSLGYKEVQDPSITVKFYLEDEPDVAILAWTTTPWTMPSNVAVAVGPDIEYAKAHVDGATYILARACVAATLGDEAEIIETFPASQLIGKRYKPPFDTFRDHPEADQAWRVIAADFITTDDGTGIAHEAPAFGADDYRVTSAEGMPVFNPIESDGRFHADFPLVGGLWFKDADKPIARDLKERGLLFSQQVTVHNYPHDWRKGTPLMNYPVESWFVATQQNKDRLVEYNNQIHWHPPHVGTGRFGDWLANNVDWALSRHRYWGTPLPIWVNDRNPDEIVVVGSIAELRDYAGDAVAADDTLDLHKPQVDAITWQAADGGTMRRVPEIIDVWFDSGAMPFAQWHYPFENKERFEANFPADFICEGVDQTRGWFYSLHAIGTLIKDSPAYKNVIVNGLLLDANGEKMSKSKGNTVDPFAALDEHGADVIRWYMLASSQPWDNTKYAERGLRDTRTKVFGTLENVYSFFATYANIDGFTADTPAPVVAERPELDRWVLSRLQSTAAEATAALDAYNPTRAARAIERFIDALSNWYIRRSRPRFWAGARADDSATADQAASHDEVADKRAAYHTTLTCLRDVAAMMAPIAPFFADWLYGQVSAQADARTSVHLAHFPVADAALTDPDLERRMALARAIVANTLALRNEAGINVRQPVARILVVEEPGVARADVEAVATIVRDEVNVDAIEFVAGEGELVKRSAKPDFKRLGKRLGKQMKTVAAAVADLSDADVVTYMRDRVITIDVDGQAIELGEGDLIVSAEGVEGWLVGREDGVTVALDSTISDSLRQRGLAREVINRVQRLRKQAEFHVADRIRVQYCADPALAAAIEAHESLLSRETLALSFSAADAPGGDVEATFEVGDSGLTLALTRAG